MTRLGVIATSIGVPALTVVLSAPQWPVARFERSLGRMSMDIPTPDGMAHGTCTAFAIRKYPARYITAAHCTTDQNIKINGWTTAVLERDEYDPTLSIAVIEVRPTVAELLDSHRTPPPSPVPLKLGRLPKKGDAVIALGYGGGAPQVMFFAGQVLSTDLPLPAEGPPRPAFFMNTVTMKGMSGGPVMDRDGRVVSVVLGGISDELAPAVSVPSPMTFGAVHARLKKLMDAFGG